MRPFIRTVLLAVLIALGSTGELRSEPANGVGRSDWSAWTASKSREVSCRYLCEGYDRDAGSYGMRFAFRNDAPVAVIVTYIGANADGSHYKEHQFLEAGEVAEKECHGIRPSIAPCKIVNVARPHRNQ